MDTKTELLINKFLVPYLHEMRKTIEAAWATGFFVDDKNTIHVWGRAPHRQDSAMIHLVSIPIVEFNRWVRLNQPKEVVHYRTNPLTWSKGQNSDSPLPARLASTSPAPVEACPPAPPVEAPETKKVASQTASPSSPKVGSGASSARPR